MAANTARFKGGFAKQKLSEQHVSWLCVPVSPRPHLHE